MRIGVAETTTPLPCRATAFNSRCNDSLPELLVEFDQTVDVSGKIRPDPVATLLHHLLLEAQCNEANDASCGHSSEVGSRVFGSAQEAPSRARKVKYLRLAVSHSVRAQTVEVETVPAESTGVDAQKRGES